MLKLATIVATTLLLVAPPLAANDRLSPVELLALWQDAEKAYDERDAQTTVALFKRLTEQSPQDPEAWFGLSRAYEWNDQNAAAAAAAERSHDLGFLYSARMAYRIAQLHARAGQHKAALRWIENSLDLGTSDRAGLAAEPDFAELLNNPGFIQVTGAPLALNISRDDGLTFDLDYLVAESQRLHADSRRPAFSEKFLKQADQLRNDIPDITDAAVMAGFMRLLAALNDGHTALYGPDPDSPLDLNAKRLPFKFYGFEEGIYIIDDGTPAKSFLGQRVAKIGDLTIDDVLSRLSDFRGVDNSMTWRWMGPQFYLGQLQMLELIGATASPDEVLLTLVDSSGKVTTQTAAGGDFEFRRKLRPLRDNVEDAPLYLSRVDDPYWLKTFESEDALYFQFNQVRNDGDESIEEFSKRLTSRLEKDRPTSLIVDVRHNNGGNNSLVKPLVQTIIAYEQANDKNRVFVITGRNTFSAAQNFVNRIEQWTDAIFVGEPSASSPNFVGEETTLLLPYSRLRGSISNLYWQDSQPYDQRRWISPRLPVAQTAADYFAGRDAALAAVLEVIASSHTR